MFEVDGMVEKPAKGTAPSNLSITGRYILQPEIFKILETQERGAGGEIQLTDAMIGLAKTQKFYGVEFEGERHDCGSKPGFLRANIAYGLARPELRDGLRRGDEEVSGAVTALHLVIARSEATKQSRLPPRRQSGLLRFARNDGGWSLTPPAIASEGSRPRTGCGRRLSRHRAPCRRRRPGPASPGRW